MKRSAWLALLSAFLALPAAAQTQQWIVPSSGSSSGSTSIASGTTPVTGGTSGSPCFDNAGSADCGNTGWSFNPTTHVLTLTSVTGNLTGNVTGTASTASAAPLSGITGFGAGVGAILGGASSGTGGPAGTISPTFTGSPVLSTATATSINGLTITSSTGTLTVLNGSTLATAGAFSTTLTATGATNVTLPTSGTLAALGGTNAWTGVNTFSNVSPQQFNGGLSTAMDTTLLSGSSTGGLYMNAQTALTPDGIAFMETSLSESIRVFEVGDNGFDFQNGDCGTSACTDPHIIVFSHNQNTAQYLSLYNDGTNSNVKGGGPLVLAASGTNSKLTLSDSGGTTLAYGTNTVALAASSVTIAATGSHGSLVSDGTGPSLVAPDGVVIYGINNGANTGARLSVAAPFEIRTSTANALALGTNGADNLTIASGGAITVTSTLKSTVNGPIGWVAVDGAATACTTTCHAATGTPGCVIGFKVTAGNIVGKMLACTDATADTCLCAGS